MLMQACNRGASRLAEAWAKPGEARRGLGEATPRTQNVLAQGQSEAHGTRNYIILLLKSSKAELEVVGACAASLEF